MKCLECTYFINGIYENDDWCKSINSYVSSTNECEKFEKLTDKYENDNSLNIQNDNIKKQ